MLQCLFFESLTFCFLNTYKTENKLWYFTIGYKSKIMNTTMNDLFDIIKTIVI